MMSELWDTESRTVLGAFEIEAVALLAISEAIVAHGRSYREPLALVREDASGISKTLTRGGVLVDRALADSGTTRLQPLARQFSW